MSNSTSTTKPLRPAFRSTNSSPSTSPAPAGMSSTQSIPSPPLSSSHTNRVAFPWEPSSPRTHSALNEAGLHSAFSHHKHQSPDRSASADGEGGKGVGFPRFATGSSAGGGVEGHYRRKVGFETFEQSTEAALFSYTLQAKSEDYRRHRSTRVFLVAVSSDESGNEALDWLMESLVEDGDEVVAVRVIELDEGEKATEKAQEGFREEAAVLLRTILDKNDNYGDRRISAIVEFVAGKITDTILRLISLYRPDSLIVGTKSSRSRLVTLGLALGAPGMGSISRFCVSHSPVPVIVVRPEIKVKKHLAKRQNDPKRGKYAALVAGGGSLTRTRSGGERSVGDRSE